MGTLLLFRHGKSDWSFPELEDFDRPLAKRGRKAAKAMGRLIAARRWVPDLVLCSAAKRTQETLQIAQDQWDREPDVIVDERLYMASGGMMGDLIANMGGSAARVMVVGHNPGTGDLGLAMTARREPEDPTGYADMRGKFPTAALAVIDFEEAAWKTTDMLAGRLHAFIKPRDL